MKKITGYIIECKEDMIQFNIKIHAIEKSSRKLSNSKDLNAWYLRKMCCQIIETLVEHKEINPESLKIWRTNR